MINQEEDNSMTARQTSKSSSLLQASAADTQIVDAEVDNNDSFGFKPMAEVLAPEIFEKLTTQNQVTPDLLIKVIKAKDFNFDSIHFTGTVPDSRDFLIFVLRSPNKSVPDKKFFFCTFGKCQKIYANLYKLFDHIRSHSNEKPYICSFGCGRGFSQIGNKNKHELYIHSQEKKVICKICNVAFKYKYNLQQHTLKVHSEKTKNI